MNAQALPTVRIDGLMQLLEAGGPVMWIIAALSVVALAIALAKLWEFARFGVWRRGPTRRALAAWEAGHHDEALQRLARAGDPTADVLRTALRGRLDPSAEEARVREEVARRGAAWLESLRGGLRPLELIGTLAPLLGLLGTVLGMIDAFRALESAGSRVDPAVLSGGIWVALLTTAAGLSVAIPAVAAHMFLERQLERLHHVMQDAATRAFNRSAALAEHAPDEDATAAGGETPAASRAPGSEPATGTSAPLGGRLAEAAGAD
ncbi:MAG: MotA/TolQ/ExbB proton channel family protein [Halofilum sp. (in: g-proteobacteria)]|nr:MotA/TolQ/ExbB proton channel family protein [Halofilum sp. (in: g-proteobacteria)]